MDWGRIVLAFASSYAKERTGRDVPPEINVIETDEPGVWRVLFDPHILASDGETVEIGMIVVTGREQLKQLPMVYQEWIKYDEGEDDAPLWGWPLRGMTEDGDAPQ